jgi:type VI secretion system protein ImpL
LAAPAQKGAGIVSTFWQTISSALTGTASSTVMMMLYGIIAAIVAGCAWFWSKHPIRWILILVTLGVILLVILNQNRIPSEDDLDRGLPALFFPPRFAWWVLVLSLSALYLSVHVAWVWIQGRRGAGTGDPSEPARFPDLEGAWDEIQIRLSHARYDAGRQKVFLLLGTDESTAAAMIRSAGLQLFAQAPLDENAPIHAYATADGLFISCAGASSWGRGEEEGLARLVELCRKILELNPEQPVLRGVAVLYPMEKAASPELLQRVGALRNDLQAIRAELNVRCPTLAVFCLSEAYAGFDEFVARIPPNVRIRRCGFSVPAAQRFDRAGALKGLGWLVQWFSTWSMKLMTDDYHDTGGNNKLVTMNAQLRRDLPALGHLLDVSFSTHARAEPILVRGCYFVSCGPDPQGHAFAAGLVSGKASKMIADAAYTTWSDGAGAIDRRYRLAALGLALSAAAISLAIWYWSIIETLEQTEVRQYARPGLWLAWACLGALALAWAAGLAYSRFGRKAPAKPADGT